MALLFISLVFDALKVNCTNFYVNYRTRCVYFWIDQGCLNGGNAIIYFAN
ncbi:MAG: hypothetical protein ACI90C_000928 [Rhodoferax sp.]|jgi:hypothetical protein